MNVDNIEQVAGCKQLSVPKFLDDRGMLCFAEAGDTIPFNIQRIFWIYGVKAGKTRGGHSHATCSEAIFPVAGACDITLNDGKHCFTLHLSDPSLGVLVPAGIWCELTNFTPDAILVVAASHHYDASGYINNYNDYLKCK